ncbi:MAG: DUF488 domain-containing protein [Chitinophagaceae bacterium]|nr:MAG: DUF488 domain-containing protein [Chitinophagaceae bacterium]
MTSERIIYTIGHSNRAPGAFFDLLQAFGIGLVADIRRLPGSRKYPHFDQEQLERSLPEQGIQYRHFAGLGGRRKTGGLGPGSPWRNASFAAYAAYMETEEFGAALRGLESEASRITTAYMCSEAVWWRCHRALVSDALKCRGWTVRHIMGPQAAKEHPYTGPAVVENGRLHYPSRPE